jgi:hypothetical protein
MYPARGSSSFTEVAFERVDAVPESVPVAGDVPAVGGVVVAEGAVVVVVVGVAVVEGAAAVEGVVVEGGPLAGGVTVAEGAALAGGVAVAGWPLADEEAELPVAGTVPALPVDCAKAVLAPRAESPQTQRAAEMRLIRALRATSRRARPPCIGLDKLNVLTKCSKTKKERGATFPDGTRA